MHSNPLRDRLLDGKSCINGWLLVPSVFTIEAMAQAGWDSLTIDIQHGLFDYASAVAGFQAMQAYAVTPLARVPVNEPGIIGKVLDAGALGIICPMVNTASQARALVEASRYPPMGCRSYGPIRARAYGGPAAYHDIANEHILVLPQIETMEAVQNLGEILDVPGISGIYVGPGDLAYSRGLPPRLDREEPEMLQLYERFIAEVTARGLIAGIQNGTAAYANRMARLGFKLLTVSSDLAGLAMSARQMISEVRQSNETAGR